MRALLVLLLAAGCSVPAVDLEGKSCPCAEGYVCDKPTNRCFSSNGDGGVIDSRGTTSCLGGSTQEIYRYAGMFDWVHVDASWSGAAEIKQSSSQVQGSYTFKTNAELTAAHDYKVTATMRQTAAGTGSPAFGIALRTQLSTQDKQHYACMFSFKAKELYIEETQGGNTTTLMAKPVAETGNAIPLTMEAKIVGSTITCCIREYPTASVSATSATVTAGYPGLETTRMAAAFGSFAVTQP
jgi:hypothetical protein